MYNSSGCEAATGVSACVGWAELNGPQADRINPRVNRGGKNRRIIGLAIWFSEGEDTIEKNQQLTVEVFESRVSAGSILDKRRSHLMEARKHAAL
jgi:hypothetical protein